MQNTDEPLPPPSRSAAATLFRQILVLPIVVPVALAAFLLLLWSLRRRDGLSLPRSAVAVALCVYLAGIIGNTVFPIFLDKPARAAAWSDFLNFVPVAGYEPADAAMNVAVLVPVGVLVALVIAHPSWTRVLAVVAVISLTIEVTQYVTAHTLGGGHVADVNDLLSNAAGGVLGWGLLAQLQRIPAVRALMAKSCCPERRRPVLAGDAAKALRRTITSSQFAPHRDPATPPCGDPSP